MKNRTTYFPTAFFGYQLIQIFATSRVVNNRDVNNADERVGSTKISRLRESRTRRRSRNTAGLIMHRGEFWKRRLFIVGRNVIWRIVSLNYATSRPRRILNMVGAPVAVKECSHTMPRLFISRFSRGTKCLFPVTSPTRRIIGSTIRHINLLKIGDCVSHKVHVLRAKKIRYIRARKKRACVCDGLR